MFAEAIYKRMYQWALWNSPFQLCQIAKLFSGKGKSCLWLLTLTEMGKPSHPNNQLSLTACFSPRSLKHHSHRQPGTSLLVPEIKCPQAHLTGVNRGTWKSELTSQSVWDVRGKGKIVLQSKDIWVIFTRLNQRANQRDTVSSNTAKVSNALVMRRLFSSTAWQHHWRIQCVWEEEQE